MKKILLALLLLLLLTGITGVAIAAPGLNSGGERNGFFIGLWQGIDTQDGSVLLLSISDNDRDGILNVRLADTFFTECIKSGYSSSPGQADGPATVKNKTLSWEFSFKCYNPATYSLFEITTGVFHFVANRRDKTLVDDDGVIFYRVEQR